MNRPLQASRGDAVTYGHPVLWLILLPLLLLLPTAFQFGVIGGGDHEMVGKLGFFKAIGDGSSLWWTESLDCGTLLLGSLSIPWTPADLLFVALDPRWASNFSHIADIILAGLGFYLWRTRSRHNDSTSALLGALTYQFSLHPLSQLVQGHQCVATQYAWLPFLLWCADILADGKHPRFVLIFPWLVFLLAMATYPSTTLVFGLVVAAYLVWRVLTLPPESGNRWMTLGVSMGWMILCAGLGVGLAAFVYVPSLEFARHCVLPGTGAFNIKDYAYHLSLPIPLLATLVLPYLFGGTFIEDKFWGNYFSPENTGAFHEFAIYGGLIVLWLLWVHRRDFLKSSEGRFWLATGGVILLISLGKWGGLYPLLKHLPVLKNLRGPCRFVAVLPLIWGCVAVLGAGMWRERPMDARSALIERLPRLILPLILISLLALGFVVGTTIMLAGRVPGSVSPFAQKLLELLRRDVLIASSTNMRILCFLAIVWGLALLLTKKRWQAGVGFLCVLSMLDLTVNAVPRIWRPSGSYAYYLSPSPLSAALRHATAEGRTRYAGLNHCVPHNLALLNDTADICGFKDFVLRWHMELVRKANGQDPTRYSLYDWGVLSASSPLLSLMRVDTLVSLSPITSGGWHEVARVGNHIIHQGPKPAPEAWIPALVRAEPDFLKRLDQLEKQVAPHPEQLALVEKESDLPSPTPQQGAVVARWKRTGNLEYQISLPHPSRGLLCTALGYYPDWEAFSGKLKLTVVRVNHAFVGVKLEEPLREVTIRFEPSSHRLGLRLSAAAGGIWFILTAWVTFRARSRRRHAVAP